MSDHITPRDELEGLLVLESIMSLDGGVIKPLDRDHIHSHVQACTSSWEEPGTGAKFVQLTRSISLDYLGQLAQDRRGRAAVWVEKQVREEWKGRKPTPNDGEIAIEVDKRLNEAFGRSRPSWLDKLFGA